MLRLIGCYDYCVTNSENFGEVSVMQGYNIIVIFSEHADKEMMSFSLI